MTGSIKSRKPAALSMVKSGRSPIRWRERHQQQMKISSDLGNRHPVTIDQLVTIKNYWDKCYEHLGTNGRTEVKQYTPPPFQWSGGIIKLLWHMIMHGSVIRTKFQVCKLQLKHMKLTISSDLGNRHPVTIDQLVMPAVELLEGWPQPKICLQITQILHKVDL
jgi:hypothetical protein